MSRFIKRAAVGAAVVALLASTAALTGAPVASGEEAAGPVPIEILSAPPAGAEVATGAQASPGYAGSATEAGTAPEATIAADPSFEGAPIGGESVIGADGRVQVSPATAYPARAIGQIEFTQNGDPFICTGWLIDSNSILTSGHCAFNPTPGGNDGIESASFFPGRDGASSPFGGCAVNTIFSKNGWRIQGRAKDDWAVMGLNCNIGNDVGYLGYFSVPGVNQLDGKTGRVEGYPGDKPFGTHWKMSGTMHSRSGADMIHYTLDTAGGQSGSPIMVANRPSCGGPCGMGIHSYGAGGNPQTNSGPRITTANFTLIQDIANDNGA